MYYVLTLLLQSPTIAGLCSKIRCGGLWLGWAVPENLKKIKFEFVAFFWSIFSGLKRGYSL
jgi:hypothetical protein